MGSCISKCMTKNSSHLKKEFEEEEEETEGDGTTSGDVQGEEGNDSNILFLFNLIFRYWN